MGVTLGGGVGLGLGWGPNRVEPTIPEDVEGRRPLPLFFEVGLGVEARLFSTAFSGAAKSGNGVVDLEAVFA